MNCCILVYLIALTFFFCMTDPTSASQLLRLPIGHAPFTPASTLLSEDFDDLAPPSLPAGWLVENANGDSYEWETVGWTSGAHTPPNSVTIMYSPVQSMDDWLFSPQVSLTQGTTYRLSFYYKAGYAGLPEYLEVRLGTAASSSDMTTQLLDLPAIDSDAYRQASVAWTATDTGGFYLGFHAYSPPNTWFLFLDTISLESVCPVSGRVTDGGGAGMTDVTVTAGPDWSTTTDDNGNYCLQGLPEGTHTVTPSKSAYTFSPSSRTVILPPGAAGQDFVGLGVVDAEISTSPSEDGSLKLDWTHWISDVEHYEVYWSIAPYFVLDDPTIEKRADVASPGLGEQASYTDPDALPQPTSTRYYLILGVDDEGNTLSISSRVGGFNFGLTPGVSP